MNKDLASAMKQQIKIADESQQTSLSQGNIEGGKYEPYNREKEL